MVQLYSKNTRKNSTGSIYNNNTIYIMSQVIIDGQVLEAEVSYGEGAKVTTKNELIRFIQAYVADELGTAISQKTVTTMIDGLSSFVTSEIANNREVRLKGIGTLFTKQFKPTNKRDLRTGVNLSIPSRHKPRLRPSSELKKAVATLDNLVAA